MPQRNRRSRRFRCQAVLLRVGKEEKSQKRASESEHPWNRCNGLTKYAQVASCSATETSLAVLMNDRDGVHPGTTANCDSDNSAGRVDLV